LFDPAPEAQNDQFLVPIKARHRPKRRTGDDHGKPPLVGRLAIFKSDGEGGKVFVLDPFERVTGPAVDFRAGFKR
jgi:hypothetical protein